MLLNNRAPSVQCGHRLTRDRLRSTATALDLHHEILEVCRTHARNASGLSQCRRSDLRELLAGLKRQRVEILIPDTRVQCELTHSLKLGSLVPLARKVARILQLELRRNQRFPLKRLTDLDCSEQISERDALALGELCDLDRMSERRTLCSGQDVRGSGGPNAGRLRQT